MHAHGAERGRRIETSLSDPVDLIGVAGVVAGVRQFKHSESVSEKWCATCERWVEVRGVTGFLRWLAAHDRHGEGEVLTVSGHPSLSCDHVIEAVAECYGVEIERIKSRSRRQDWIEPRQIAMFLCRRYTTASRASIGEVFGRAHTSVKNAETVIARKREDAGRIRDRTHAVEIMLDRIAAAGGNSQTKGS